MAASEAVMVSPEQSATAPKTLVAQHAAPAKTSTTRLVLLAVLALAAATGAMFGAVVLGNQLTQELHPKGSSHLNSVTLVDSEDRAIATTAVESYVSLLDLPLLGTAELNKVDGITFSTNRGIEHRKVTGYTVTTETARVGDSEVKTPRLSLTTSAPGVTVEVSVRDNKAWLSEAEGGSTTITVIDTTSQRRLADGGSCLESGACLYSRDELLRLDAASRRLEEGSFFARADVAAYQVELSGDLMQYLEGAREEGTLDGTFSENGHSFRLRFEQAPAGNRFLFTNYTNGESKLVTSEAHFVFSANGRLMRCNAVIGGMQDISKLSIDNVAEMVAFDTLDATHGTSQKIIPFDATVEECLSLSSKQVNMSTPEALERFPQLAAGVQQSSREEIQDMGKSFFGLTSRRRLAAATSKFLEGARAQLETKELVDIMTNPASGREMTMEELAHPDSKRVLEAARAKAHSSRELSTLTSFDLWVATRLADPAVKSAGYFIGDPSTDSLFSAATAVSDGGLGPGLAMDLGGLQGVSVAFVEWSGFQWYGGYGSGGGVSEAFVQGANSGVCAGGVNEYSADMDATVISENCESILDWTFEADTAMMQEVKMEAPCECMGYLDDVDDCIGVNSETCKRMLSGDMGVFKEACEEEQKVRRLRAPEPPRFAVPGGRGGPVEVPRSHAHAADIWEPPKDEEPPADEDKDEGPEHCEGYAEKLGTMTCREKVEQILPFCMPFVEKYAHMAFNPTADITEACARRRLSESKHEDRELSTGTFKKPNAYASVLFKQKKFYQSKAYVASFQATKLSEPAMIQYSTKKAPAVFTWKGVTTATTEGYALYASQTFPCITKMIESLPAADSISYVTGHSIGGAAATLLSLTLGSEAGSLVSFGAPAVFPPNYKPSKVRGKYSLNAGGYSALAEAKEEDKKYLAPELGEDAFSVPGIRFFHKFDPVPGYVWGLGWKHGVTTPKMVYDSEGPCSTSGTFTVDSNYYKVDYDGGGVGTIDTQALGTLKTFLCTQYNVKANTDSSPSTEYSYTFAVNPFPCIEAELGLTVAALDSDGYDVSGIPTWSFGETTAACAESFIASTVAYTYPYLTSSLYDINPIYDSDYKRGEELYLAIFYTFFGLMWIHSSYANYALPI